MALGAPSRYNALMAVMRWRQHASPPTDASREEVVAAAGRSASALDRLRLQPDDARTALKLARDSVGYGLAHGLPLEVDSDRFPPRLRQRQACFVTLHRGAEFRGCVGGLEAQFSLAEALVVAAFNAAFRDPRIIPIEAWELPLLRFEISILSALEEMRVASEADLLQQLQRGVDGLVLIEGKSSSTLLPKVWEQIDDPRVFLQHLKRKAGLRDDHWSPTLRFQRYQAFCFGDDPVPVSTQAS
jgi:AmmeMemoRadiSam system protein A